MKLDKSKYDAEGKLKNGKLTDHYKGGEVCSIGRYVGGEKDGVWKFYFRNGNLQATGKYKKDKVIGALEVESRERRVDANGIF